VVFPGTAASSTTKTGRHDIADILLKLKLALKHQKSINQSNLTVCLLDMICKYIVLYHTLAE
jgi:carbon starvation protein CstA